jgi:hypothetical protein
MANDFLKASKRAISMHGKSAVYKAVSASVYNIELGTNVDTSVNYNLMVYRKQIRATQYNYPNLIGKESAVFYIANDNLSFVPKLKDKISYEGSDYIVDSMSEHIALGQVVMYKVIGVKG